MVTNAVPNATGTGNAEEKREGRRENADEMREGGGIAIGTREMRGGERGREDRWKGDDARIITRTADRLVGNAHGIDAVALHLHRVGTASRHARTNRIWAFLANYGRTLWANTHSPPSLKRISRRMRGFLGYRIQNGRIDSGYGYQGEGPLSHSGQIEFYGRKFTFGFATLLGDFRKVRTSRADQGRPGDEFRGN